MSSAQQPGSAGRVLVIVHEPGGESALVGDLLAERGYEIHEHVVTADVDRPNDAVPFPDFSDYDIVVAMGSVRSLTDTDEISNWIFTELDLLRAAHERGTPILGICFGGQMLAETLGGSVSTAPYTEIGWYEIAAPDGASSPVGPGPWFEWHHDCFEPPPDAEVLAVNDCSAQMFRIGRSVGTQFHPEVTHAHVKGFLAEAPAEYLDEHGLDPERLLSEVRRHEERNAVQCIALVDWFLNDVATTPDP